MYISYSITALPAPISLPFLQSMTIHSDVFRQCEDGYVSRMQDILLEMMNPVPLPWSTQDRVPPLQELILLAEFPLYSHGFEKWDITSWGRVFSILGELARARMMRRLLIRDIIPTNCGFGDVQLETDLEWARWRVMKFVYAHAGELPSGFELEVEYSWERSAWD